VQVDIVETLVQDAVAKGAKLLVGGKRLPEKGSRQYYTPTILADVVRLDSFLD
jgi:succinate-semialdehyde dehydrogenase / glutarate-semialdehyde dehydrogenase